MMSCKREREYHFFKGYVEKKHTANSAILKITAWNKHVPFLCGMIKKAIEFIMNYLQRLSLN